MVWNANIFEPKYLTYGTYHSNLNYDRLLIQTPNLDGLDNHPQVWGRWLLIIF